MISVLTNEYKILPNTQPVNSPILFPVSQYADQTNLSSYRLSSQTSCIQIQTAPLQQQLLHTLRSISFEDSVFLDHSVTFSVLPHRTIFSTKPTGHVTHQQFNIQQLYVLPTLYVFCIYLRTNSDLCHLQHKLIGFYNRDEKCLFRGTNWVFK